MKPLTPQTRRLRRAFVTFENIKALFAGHEPDPAFNFFTHDESWFTEVEILTGFEIDILDWSFGYYEGEFWHYNPKGHAALGKHLCRKGDYGSGNPIKSGSGSNDSIDVVFVFDTTVSMGDDIAAANAAATGILARLGAKTTSFRGAVVDYRDFPDRGCPTEDYASNLVLDFTSDLDAIKNAFDSLDLGCGDDFAETVWSGLMTAFSLPWRPGVKKISVVFAVCPTEDYASNLVLDFTSDLDAIKNAFDNLDLGCGGDFAETMWSGLMTAFSLPWRPGVKKISVVFADAPALNPEPNTGYTIDTIVSTSKALDPVAVYAIDTGSAGPEIRYVALETGGEVFAGSSSDVPSRLEEILE